MDQLIYGFVSVSNYTMTILGSKIKKFRSDDSGATAVEYALIIGLVAVVIIGAITLLGGSISEVFKQAACVVKGGTWTAGVGTAAGTCS